MQYSQNDYIFLGKQVAAGTYVRRSTFLLALVLALLVGMGLGSFVFPKGGGLALPLQVDGGAGASGGAVPSGELTATILQHEQNLRQNPDNAAEWAHLGNLYYDADEPQKSINAYERSLALEPNNTSVLVDCGVMYRELEQYDKALEYFDKALKLDPTHETALFNTGIVLYHDQKKTEQGLDAWRRLVQINPQAVTPRGGLVSDMIKELARYTRPTYARACPRWGRASGSSACLRARL